jgi:hypothetical protein
LFGYGIILFVYRQLFVAEHYYDEQIWHKRTAKQIICDHFGFSFFNHSLHEETRMRAGCWLGESDGEMLA